MNFNFSNGARYNNRYPLDHNNGAVAHNILAEVGHNNGWETHNDDASASEYNKNGNCRGGDYDDADSNVVVAVDDSTVDSIAEVVVAVVDNRLVVAVVPELFRQPRVVKIPSWPSWPSWPVVRY